MSAVPFTYFREYYRVVADVFVTDEGVFKKVPEDISSPVLTIQSVYRVCVATDGGELQILDFPNPPLMDSERKVGGDVLLDGEYWYTEEGEEGEPLECVTVFSTAYGEDWSSRAAQMHAIAKTSDQIPPNAAE